ncbi:MAG TPA: peptidoglycan DD-metalloendopeptidase family protein [Candidatus Cryosericum sp.]|nr:peptidoglycan DD-metalloendopeptidase family protein [Candidatus Cryosericum sp.]
MARKYYTIMIVPHATAKFRRVRVSRNLLIAGVIFVSIMVTAGLMVPHFLIKTARLSASVRKMTEENATLRKSNERFDASLSDLRSKLSDIETKAAKFALMVGVEDAAAQPLPAGGSSFDIKGLPARQAEPIIEGEIRTLRERSGALQDSFRVLDTAFQKQALLLSSTPSIYPVRGLLGNGFGWRRDPFTGMRDFHQGLDIVAPIGTRVVAPADGIVTRVGPAGGFGLSVFISHGFGIVTRYGHLSGASVRVGQRVKRGDDIAATGSTGRSTGPHLHYEVLVHQKCIDPIKYILEESKVF